MADISIQFHALPGELLPFVRQNMAEFRLHLVALQYRPFILNEIDPNRLDAYISEHSSIERFQFTIESPVLSVAHELEFSARNPDSLRLDVGRRTENGLNESWLCARTENPVALATWKTVAKRLKRITVKGAIAINPKTGASSPARGHRFTQGARVLASSGVAMLTVTGNVLQLGDQT